MATAGGAGLWDPLSRSQPKTFERSNWDNPSLPLSRLVRRWERCDWPRARGLVPRGYHLLTGRAGKCTRHCPRREAHLTQRGTTRLALGRLSRPHTPTPSLLLLRTGKEQEPGGNPFPAGAVHLWSAGATRRGMPGRALRCPRTEAGEDGPSPGGGASGGGGRRKAQ